MYLIKKINTQSQIGSMMQPLPDKKNKVAILLATYHGQRFLEEQMQSFLTQTHCNWSIWASDDGSQDGTRDILDSYESKLGGERMSVHSGPEEGFVPNFLSLTCRPQVDADYFAYSDQDDVWEPNKLSQALSYLEALPPEVPALYCGRTKIVDESLNLVGYSPLFSRPPGFANALVQNVGGGNTMVFNRAARNLLCIAGEYIDVQTHDWWAYLVISACGGVIIYDKEAKVSYRQHGSNLVGQNSSWKARFKRVCMLFEGCFRRYNDRHIIALQGLRPYITPQNLVVLDCFIDARRRSLLSRMFGLYKSGIYRQTFLGNLGLFVGGLFNKI